VDSKCDEGLFLQLIPLQGPLKTMLQISVVPLINSESNYVDIFNHLFFKCFERSLFCSPRRIKKRQ